MKTTPSSWHPVFLICLVLLAVLVAPWAVCAADEFNKQPMMGFSLGYGTAETLDEIGWESGIVPGMRFLVPVSANWKVGGEMQGWTYLGSEDPRPQRNMFYLGPIVTWGKGRHGPFLGASLGFGSLIYEVYDDEGNRNRASQGGWGFGFSAGWMFQTSDKFAFGPRLDYVYLDVGKASVNNEQNDRVLTPQLLTLAVAIEFP